MPAHRLALLAVVSLFCALAADSFVSPAGSRPAHRHPDASILPGGRVIAPLGQQHITGAGPFGLTVSANGRIALTANTGPGRNSLSILQSDKAGVWRVNHWPARTQDKDDDDGDLAGWRGVFMGTALASDHSAWVSEGNSGKVSLFDWSSEHRRSVNLNTGSFTDSYTGDLAYDPEHSMLYVLEQGNFRVAVIDTRAARVIASIKTGRLPFAIALSPDRHRLYVTNIGMFEYQAIPGADPAQARSTGIPFPAFGFPSVEAVSGVERATERGPVKVPGLGDPNLREANSVAVVDVSTPAAPKLVTFVRTGLPFGAGVHGGSSPCGILATTDQVFVANTNDDSITVIDARTNTVTAEIPIRIPGMESLRGVLPIGLAWHETNGWLLAAEAGINAVAVIDAKGRRVLGHLPAGWFPTRIAVAGDTVFVANGRGLGQGPNNFAGAGREGSVSIFPMPAAGELDAHTAFVLEANGFRARPAPEPPLPAGIRHVVLIVKENRTFDEVFGDVPGTMGAPGLARFGMRGYVDGERKRVSLRDVEVTPNHHSMARRWSIGDNFYADSDVSVDGHHWLAGSPPNAWTESSLMAAYGEQKKDFRLGSAPGRLLFAGSDSSVHPEEQLEGGTLWHHLERHGVSFRNFGEGFELAGVNEGKDLEPTGARFLTNVPMPDPLYRNTSRQYPGFNMNVPDQYRAAQFIAEIQERYIQGTEDLPRFIFIHLPNDHTDGPRPADGYPYRESYVADNDYALGRIVEFLSGTKYWKEMAVFVTEDDAQGGVDHVDAHRTVLMAMGPWIKRDYVTHRNSSFPGLLKTIFRLLGMPALNLYDASATDLSDIFTTQADPATYKLLPVDQRIFDPAAVRISTSGKPGAKMDAK
ncbi:MAG TPA: alkaline phosphatase family protein [Candidatus Acidoferrum sp.]|nr:alkaline phosphatase family protein [Candidatus Acidoferrum sp.]